MGAIAWIWAGLMLLGGMRLYFARDVAPDFAYAIILSGLIAMPLLWNRDQGLLGRVAPSGIVRAGLAVVVLIVAGCSFPDDVLGLIPAIA